MAKRALSSPTACQLLKIFVANVAATGSNGEDLAYGMFNICLALYLLSAAACWRAMLGETCCDVHRGSDMAANSLNELFAAGGRRHIADLRTALSAKTANIARQQAKTNLASATIYQHRIDRLCHQTYLGDADEYSIMTGL